MTLQKDKVIVVDLEATCWKKDPPKGQQSEIIEIGICRLHLETGKIDEKRGFLIKPTRSTMSDYCTSLTSITPEQLAEGVTFEDACQQIADIYQPQDYLWGSWGGYDLRMFKAQSELFGVSYPMSESHVNLKQLYGDVQRKGRRCGLARAIRYEGLTMDGHHHRGMDDAWNTAQLLFKLIQQHGTDILEAYWA